MSRASKTQSQSFTTWQWLCVGILLCAAFFGIRGLDSGAYWVDEVISMQRSGHAWYVDDASPAAVWERTALISDQVPGYYIVLGLWGNVVGISPFAMRSLALFFGVLSIAVAYQIGKSLHNDRTGFAVALALASSAFYLLFLHEMRTYTLLVLCIGLMLWFYWQIAHTKAAPRWMYVGLVLAVAMLLYSYYLSIVVIGAVCLYHLVFVQKNRAWWRVVILMGMAGILYLPWFLTSFSILEDTDRNAIRQIHTVSNIEALEHIAGTFSNQNRLLLILLLAATLTLQRRETRYLWFVFAASLGVMLALNPWLGVLVNLRYALPLYMSLALLAGYGLEQLMRYGVPAPLLLGVIFVSGVVSAFDTELERQYDLPIRYLPWDTLTETLSPYEQSGDVMTFLVNIEGNDWEGVHEERVMPHYFMGSEIEPIYIEDVRNLPDADFLREAEAIANEADRIWLSYTPRLRSWRTGLFQDELLDNGFATCGNIMDSNALYVDLYAHPRATDDATVYTFSADEGVTIAGLALLQTIPASVSDRLHLVHGWTLDPDFPRGRYSLAVHLLDASGTLVAQADYGIPAEDFSCTLTTIALDGIPAESYQVRLFGYAWEDGTRLPLVNNSTSEVLSEMFQVNTE